MSAKAGFLQSLRNVLTGKAAAGSAKDAKPVEVQVVRRRLVTASVLGCLGVNFLMFLRFFFPRTLFEPK
ncbi:MAG: hypothetical protein ACRD88_15070, partial [Terriglobia bacterium]